VVLQGDGSLRRRRLICEFARLDAVARASVRGVSHGFPGDETADLKQALADRKIIERAKALLMKPAGMDEQQPSNGCRNSPAKITKN